MGAITAVKLRAPVLGGNFGVWGGLFSTFDCTVKGIRRKEDPYNAIIAGFFTGGALAVRGGYKAMRNGAIGCAVLLAVIEGVGIGIGKYFAGNTKLEVSLVPGVAMMDLFVGDGLWVMLTPSVLRLLLLRGLRRGRWPNLRVEIPFRRRTFRSAFQANDFGYRAFPVLPRREHVQLSSQLDASFLFPFFFISAPSLSG